MQTIGVLVQGYWTVTRLRGCWSKLSRYLCSRRRQRVHQESRMRVQLLNRLGQTLPSASLIFRCSSA